MNEEIHAFENLGGKPRVPSTKDHLIGSVTAPQYTFKPVHPRSYTAPHYFQGKRPACGAHAGTSLKVFLNINDGTNVAENDTPRALWMNIKRDGTSPSDGTSMDAIFKALTTYGAVAFEPLENNVTFDDLDYAALHYLTAAMMTQGLANKLSSYAYLTDHSFNGIKQGIDDFGAVLILVNANAQMWTAPNGQTSWAEKDVLPLRPPSAAYPVVDGHFLLCDSYDEQYIYGLNSFGPTWGRAGDFYFGQDYASQILEAGIGHNAPKPSPAVAQAISTVQNDLPSVRAAMAHVQTLPEAQQGPLKEAIAAILTEFSNLLKNAH